MTETAVNVTPGFIEGERITLKSGVIVAWVTRDICEFAELRVCPGQNFTKTAWVYLDGENGEERDFVNSKRPVPQPVPGNHKARLSLEYVDASKIVNEIWSWLSADCWAVYVADKNRLLGVRQIYYDTRLTGVFSESATSRGEAAAVELRGHIDEGHTVVMVMGQTKMTELHFSKVPGCDRYLIASVDHFKDRLASTSVFLAICAEASNPQKT